MNLFCYINNNYILIKGNGRYCAPIPDHSCHNGNNCSPYGYCSIDPNTQNYYCACLPGYTGDGYTCTIQEVVTTTTTAETEITNPTTEPISKLKNLCKITKKCKSHQF